MRRMLAVFGMVLALTVTTVAPARAGVWVGFIMGRGSDGVRANKVLAGSPAARAGLKTGDVVLSVNGTRVRRARDILAVTSRMRVGSRIALRYRRGSAVMSGSAVTVSMPKLEKLLKLILTGERAPNFRLATVDGGTITLASLRGKVVVLEFWATWCKSCKISLRKLKKLYWKHKKSGLAVVALARNTVAQVKPEARRLGLPFAVAADPKARVATRYRLSKVPSMVLVDRRGVIRDVWLGSRYSPRWLEGRVVKLLKRKP